MMPENPSIHNLLVPFGRGLKQSIFQQLEVCTQSLSTLLFYQVEP
jgi:hypothetical protein